MKIKNTPNDSFAPRGKEVVFLGVVPDITNGSLVGQWNGYGWGLERASTLAQRGTVNQEEFKDQEELDNDPDGANTVKNDPKVTFREVTEHDVVKYDPLDGKELPRDVKPPSRVAPKRGGQQFTQCDCTAAEVQTEG